MRLRNSEREPILTPDQEAEILRANQRHDETYGWSSAAPQTYSKPHTPEFMPAVKVDRNRKDEELDPKVWEAIIAQRPLSVVERMAEEAAGHA